MVWSNPLASILRQNHQSFDDSRETNTEWRMGLDASHLWFRPLGQGEHSECLQVYLPLVVVSFEPDRIFRFTCFQLRIQNHETHANSSRDRFAAKLSTVCHSSSSKNTNNQSVSTLLPSAVRRRWALLLFINATVHRDDGIEIRIRVEKSPERE